jgi:hypothetical protein
MNYTCPVCGYTKLIAPPKDYMICPSCGTEFGNDDFEFSHEELRQEWIAAGAPWFSRRTAPPSNWNPFAQLVHAGYGVNVGLVGTALGRHSLSFRALFPRNGIRVQVS